MQKNGTIRGAQFPGGRLLHLAPELFILVAVTVFRIERVLGTAIEFDIVGGDDMERGEIARPLLAGKGAVQLVDKLPALQVEGSG
ncbi:hypothetical protein SAMN02927900_01755 [Rhizobium mongolense subsp. loessense]|uniref:Uncharacterized protein n=1 Tax=Rhizobium mongolense subsp. loessense TaxID=158890 RepID=A0A1G4QRN9_9HYPH|nr:hypothetical protein SAMN02927900_01755 [Rhizobium mongolense subsp. loessense]